MREIHWEKWNDPFKPLMEMPEFEEDDYGGSRKLYSGPTLVGPMGILPLTEENSPSQNFQLWVGHSNFDLGQKEFDLAETTPGVELLRFWTRYRMWVGVGMNFLSAPVLDEIERRLCVEPVSQECPECCPDGDEPPEAALFSVLDEAYAFWAVRNLPEGKIDVFGADEQSPVEERVKSWSGDGSHILTSWGEDA